MSTPQSKSRAASRPPGKPRPLIASEKGQVSLFPFMSILACLIGILALLIGLSLVVNQEKEGMTQEEVNRAKEHQTLQLLVKKKQKELEQRRQSLEATRLSTMEMEKLKQMLLELEQEKHDLEAVKLPPEEELRAKIQIYRDETAALAKEQPSLQTKIDELNAKLAQLKEIPQPKESVKIRPPRLGAKVPRNLYFVECNSTGIILRGASEESISISLASIKSGSVEFAEFCHKVKTTSGSDHMVLFLVRKGGREVYEYANASAELDFKVKTGKLPVPNEGKIDLSQFFLKKL